MNEDATNRARFSSLFQAAQREHYYQLALIDSLIAKSKILMGFLIALTVYIASEFGPVLTQLENGDIRMIVAVPLLAVSILLSALFLVRAFKGLVYRQLGSLSQLEARLPENTKDEEALVWLQHEYYMCATFNCGNNKIRMGFMDKGTYWLLTSVVLAIPVAAG